MTLRFACSGTGEAEEELEELVNLVQHFSRLQVNCNAICEPDSPTQVIHILSH